MDEQQQAAQNAEQVDPTQPVTEEQTPEQSTQPETPQEEPQPDPSTEPSVTQDQATQDVQQAVKDQGSTPEAVDPTQDFIDAYTALCSEKGKQFNYQLSFNTRDDGSFDLTKASIVRVVVDLPQE